MRGRDFTSDNADYVMIGRRRPVFAPLPGDSAIVGSLEMGFKILILWRPDFFSRVFPKRDVQ